MNRQNKRQQLPQARQDAGIPESIRDCTMEQVAREFLLRCDISNGLEFVPVYILGDVQTHIHNEIRRRSS